MESETTIVVNQKENEKQVQSQNRLCTSNVLYNDKEKCHIFLKTISFNQTINFFDHMDKIMKNYNVYQQKLLGNPFCILPHIKTFQRSENYAFLIQRQSLKKTLNDKISQLAMEVSEIDTFWIFSQILFSVSLMHLKKLPHCNLSCSNILLTSSDNVYITDMGLIQPHLLRQQDYNIISFLYPHNHNEFYLSPERFTKTKTEYVNLELSIDDREINMLLKSDVFAVGCMLYKFLTKGKILFNIQKLHNMINSNDYQEFVRQDIEEVRNKDHQRLILDMINPDFEKRISIKEAFHRWNSFFLVANLNDQTIIYHFSFLLRHQMFFRADFQVFLIAILFAIIEEKKLFGIQKSSVEESTEMLGIVFQRFFELIASSKVSDFMEFICPLFFETSSQSTNANFLNEIYKKAKNLLDELSIKPLLSNKLIDVINRQNESVGRNLLKKIRNKNHLDLKLKKKESFLKMIGHFEEVRPKDGITVSSIFMRILLRNFLDCDTEEGINLGLSVIKKYVKNMSSKDILVHIVPMLFFGLKLKHQKIYKLKFLRTLTWAFKSIRFLDCPEFTKMQTIDKYVFSIIRYIFNSQNDLLILSLLRNLKVFIKVCFVISISGVKVSENRHSIDQILNSKTYLCNYFEIRNFFMDKIERALDNPNYTTVVLRQINKFIEYMSDFESLKNFIKLTLKYIQRDNSMADAILLFPFFLNNECQLIRSHIKILISVLNSEREEILLASLCSISTIVKTFRTLDPLFFKNEILKPMNIFYKKAPTQLVKARVILIFQNIFRRLSEKDINKYFIDDVMLISELDTQIGNFSKGDIEKIFSKIIFSGDLSNILNAEKNNSSRFKTTIPTLNSMLLTNLRNQVFSIQASTKTVRNFQNELFQFLFAYFLIEVTSTYKDSDYRINESFEQYLLLINLKINENTSRGVTFDISKIEAGDSLNWNEMAEFLRNMHKNLNKFPANNLTLLYNREKALLIIESFLKFIEINHITTINNSLQFVSTVDLFDLRQKRPKGNIKATLFDSKSSIKCLEKGKESLFFAGNSTGEVFTYNLETLSSKDSLSLLVHKHRFENPVPITKVIADDNCTTIIGKKDSTISLYDFTNNKITKQYEVAKNAYNVDLKFVQGNGNGVLNSFISVDDTGKLNVFDIRMKTGCYGMKLNPVMGIPTCLIECSKLFNQYYLSTNRGFITRYDLRMNMFCEFFRLQNNDSFLPITSMAEFIPTSKFQNISEQNNCLLLTYPSDNNEFSIFDFDVKEDNNEPLMPKIHFVAEFNSPKGKNEIQVSRFPSIKLVENQSIFNLKEEQFFDSFEILKVLAEKKQIFKNNPQSYLSMIDGFMKTLITENNILSGFNVSQEIDTLIKLKNKDQSIRKVLVYPSYQSTRRYDKIAFDNIILTAGEDRIIRFLNFGNSLAESHSIYSSSGVMSSYHLFNPDLMDRSFYYSFCGDVMVMKENTIPSVVKNKEFNIVQHSFGGEVFSEKETENGQSLMQKYNFSSEINNKKSFLARSVATPCHELEINDLLLMKSKNIYIISGGEDGHIKIWD